VQLLGGSDVVHAVFPGMAALAVLLMDIQRSLGLRFDFVDLVGSNHFFNQGKSALVGKLFFPPFFVEERLQIPNSGRASIGNGGGHTVDVETVVEEIFSGGSFTGAMSAGHFFTPVDTRGVTGTEGDTDDFCLNIRISIIVNDANSAPNIISIKVNDKFRAGRASVVMGSGRLYWYGLGVRIGKEQTGVGEAFGTKLRGGALVCANGTDVVDDDIFGVIVVEGRSAMSFGGEKLFGGRIAEDESDISFKEDIDVHFLNVGLHLS